MRRVLVTGGNGYIGRHVTQAVADRGDAVVAAVRSVPEDPIPGVEYRALDLFDQEARRGLLDGGYDLCIHAAWENGFQHNNPSHMEQVSDHFKLLEAVLAAGTEHIAVLGSMHEIGYHEGEIGEDTPEAPTTIYGIAKCALKNTLRLHMQSHYPNATFQWLRAYYIFGDDLRNHSVFTKLLLAAQEGKEEFPFTSGTHQFDFITIQELSRQIAAVTAQNEVTGVIECCSGVPVSLGEKMEQFIQENDLSIRLKYGAFPEPAHESPGVWGSTEKLKKAMAADPAGTALKTQHPMRGDEGCEGTKR